MVETGPRKIKRIIVVVNDKKIILYHYIDVNKSIGVCMKNIIQFQVPKECKGCQNIRNNDSCMILTFFDKSLEVVEKKLKDIYYCPCNKCLVKCACTEQCDEFVEFRLMMDTFDE